MSETDEARSKSPGGCALRPDAQAFDEIRIVTVPRFKESELSGDEWRIHAEAQFYRKGKLIFSQGCRNTETAAGLLYAWYVGGIGDGKAYYAGDGITCDQEGCHEPATVRLRRLVDYCDAGHGSAVFESSLYRHFCERHKERGDCGFDDADANYVEEPMFEKER
jgi:hypothetical protein